MDVAMVPAQDLERFRAYLYLLARMQLDHRLRRDCDASDIVQTVLLKAHQNQGGFRGETAEELGAWLRQILAHTLANALRDRLRGRRDLRREVDVENALNDSSLRLTRCATSSDPSPSVLLQGKEDALRLANALTKLPEVQREAVTLRYLEELTFLEVSDLMKRSPVAVASLLRRGLANLRKLLAEELADDT